MRGLARHNGDRVIEVGPATVYRLPEMQPFRCLSKPASCAPYRRNARRYVVWLVRADMIYVPVRTHHIINTVTVRIYGENIVRNLFTRFALCVMVSSKQIVVALTVNSSTV